MIKYKRQWNTNLKDKIKIYFTNNIVEYTIIVIILFIGIILGTLYVKNIKNNEQLEIYNYINNFMNSIHNGSKIDFNNLFKSSLKNNFFLSLSLGIAGLTVIGMPILYIIIAFKGFSIGYTISSIVGVLGTGDGIKFVLSTLFLQNIILLPCIIILTVSGIKLYKSIMKDRRRENIKLSIFKYLILLFIILIFILISSLVEAYISGNLFMLIFT